MRIDVKTPYFYVDEALLIRNLEILRSVIGRTGCKILLAQKAFSMYSLYPLISRYLHGDCLETARLYCSLGALEVFFDQAKLSPNGAEVSLECKLGAISIYVPKTWRVVDRINCTLGGVDMDNRYASPAEGAPQLTLTGSVSLGGIEVRYI